MHIFETGAVNTVSIVNTLVPVLGLILVGFFIQRFRFLDPSFWPSAEKLTYFLLMPATLIHNLAGKEIGDLPWSGLMMTVEGTVVLSAVLVTLWWLVRRNMDGPVFTSLFQGGVRFNSFVALALAENMFGSHGLAIAALGGGLMIILINILCVSAFSLTVTSGGKFTVKRLLTDLMKNPLIIGCVVGVGINISGLQIPSAIDGMIALSGKAAFPVGLMAVGAAYRAGRLSVHIEPLAVSSIVQFFIKPAFAWMLALYTGLSGVALGVVILLFSVPTAPSAYVLSRQMGGDADSMSAIITVQTCLSFVTLPFTVWLLQ